MSKEPSTNCLVKETYLYLLHCWTFNKAGFKSTGLHLDICQTYLSNQTCFFFSLKSDIFENGSVNTTQGIQIVETHYEKREIQIVQLPKPLVKF